MRWWRGAGVRNDEDMKQHSRGAISRPSFAIRCPSENRGRRECRALNRTRNPRGLKRKMPTSRQAGPKSHGTPCAMVLRLLRALPGVSGRFSHRRSPMISASHPAPRFVTIAKRLFGERGMASINHKFCLSERYLFLCRALDSSGKTGGVFWCFACRIAGATRCRLPMSRGDRLRSQTTKLIFTVYLHIC